MPSKALRNLLIQPVMPWKALHDCHAESGHKPAKQAVKNAAYGLRVFNEARGPLLVITLAEFSAWGHICIR